MSARKKKNLPGLQQIFDSIKDLLITTKPHLDNPEPSARPALIEKLRQVATLAESFVEQRPRSNKSWMQLSDELDQEGVNLWNISGLVQKTPADEGRMLVAALRLAAFRLIEAGLELKPGIKSLSLVHVLQLASKTGATLSEAGNGEVAGSVLTSAARFEELLRNAEDAGGAHRVDRACATIVYFSSRMEAAWKEGNHSVATYMAQKIMDDEQRLSLLPPHDRERLACKLHDIGKSVLKSQGDGAAGNEDSEAVIWLQRAFAVTDKLDDAAAHAVPELKISILRTMARAYFISGSYDRAEAALDELIPTIDAFSQNGRSEYQELRWLRLAVLKRRKAGESALLDAFKSIIDHMTFCETNITDVLQDLRTLSNQHVLVTAVNQHCLQQLLAAQGVEPDCVNRLLLSLIVHCSKDEDHSRALAAIDSAFTATFEAEYNLLKLPATACLTLIWQYGDRHFNAKRWSAAADWFLAGSHQLFRAACPTSGAKCFRKAALCYIEQREYARASAVIRRCPSTEATTHYVLFLTAVHQGLDDEAIRAIRDMVKAADFDRKMLLLATQISHESEMKTVLLSVLEALLKTLKIENNGETVVEAMTLIRCIIRLVLKLLVEPASNKPVLIETLISHFHIAKILAEAACAQKAIALIIKDVSWLWRTAYNCAVQGCAEWERNEERIALLFEVARDLITTCCEASPVDVDADLYLHLINASFSGVSGRVFAGRLAAASGSLDANRLRETAGEVRMCKQKILSITAKNTITAADDILRVQYFLHVLRVFEAELLAQLKDWDGLSQIVTDVVTSGPLGVGTYEAIADILWAEPDCPINVLLSGLEVSYHYSVLLVLTYPQAILRASLDQNSLSVEKFSRWLRAICTIILARNTPADRVKAIGYVEQAVSVIEDNSEGDDGYPVEERNWLLGTSYNTGFECLEASMLDEAKRWFESATVICRFVPGGKERAEKISETYTHLLARYNPT
ncbi:meiosis protein SPO22/ZIP4 like-domain-containing protein [Mycena alexandri]|uniref:Meiosis protein SPO22/ZIP4 like-domain-containing protein n=1 Tax=Mycena alexandri TaxID=1745969 RepID=A0AAD6SMC0_9AGAR|nr:meiosis protein SPO22/ZIP4 like-domain-containing protein [Mycena alexandri]